MSKLDKGIQELRDMARCVGYQDALADIKEFLAMGYDIDTIIRTMYEINKKKFYEVEKNEEVTA